MAQCISLSLSTVFVSIHCESAVPGWGSSSKPIHNMLQCTLFLSVCFSYLFQFSIIFCLLIGEVPGCNGFYEPPNSFMLDCLYATTALYYSACLPYLFQFRIIFLLMIVIAPWWDSSYKPPTRSCWIADMPLLHELG